MSLSHIPARWFHLSAQRNQQGIFCGDAGAFVGAIPLLSKTIGG
jgi:hypothetical protein